MQVEEAAVDYAASRLHEIKQSRGLPALSASFVRGNLFAELQAGRAAETFDCLHVGGSCNKDKIRELLRLVKPGGRSTFILIGPYSGLIVFHTL